MKGNSEGEGSGRRSMGDSNELAEGVGSGAKTGRGWGSGAEAMVLLQESGDKQAGGEWAQAGSSRDLNEHRTGIGGG